MSRPAIPRSTLGSRIALVLAAVILPFAVLSSWVDATVSNTDRFVDTVAPLAKDEVVQRAAQQKLETVVLNAIDIDQRRSKIQDLLDDQSLSPLVRRALTQLGNTLETAITGAVHNASVRVVESPEFPIAWADANRSAHTQLIGVLSGEDEGLIDANGRVSVQLNTLVTTVVGILEADEIVDASQLPELEASFTFAQADDLDKAQTIYNLLDRLGFWLPVLWLLLVAAAIVFAVDRRRAIRLLAYCSIAGLILLAIGLRVARNQLIGAGLVADEDLVLAVWNILLAGLKSSIWVLLIGSLLVAGGEWLTGSTTYAVQIREFAGRSTGANLGPDVPS